MRDTITPVTESFVLPIRVDTYGKEISGISYEVRSLDTTRLVQSSDAVNQTEDGDAVTAELKLEELLESGQEYLLILTVRSEDDTWYYYTRIVEEGESRIQESLDFAEEFHAITMDKSRQSELAAYMEPSSGSDNKTLQTVTINNSLSQACWGNFEGQEVTEPVASIKELNDSYNVILLTYILSSVGEDGALEYYNVEEYYRVRVGTEKAYLLSFERTVEEIFRGESSQISGDSITLGIRSGDVDFKSNATGRIICFVQQGELWSYNLDEDKLTQVFSFRSTEGMDVRENYGEHDIQIVRADETGNIDFIVYGYMNRGSHEGEVGISVCHYDSVTNTVEEQLFLPTTVSYQMIKEKIGELMYISDSGMFYFAIGNQIYQIDLTTKEAGVLIGEMTEDSGISSENGRYLAWTQGEANTAQVMHITDLETGTTRDITADTGCVIKPMAFLGTDCVYGIADSGELAQTESGVVTPAMKRLVIVDCTESELTELKSYEGNGAYVVCVTAEGGDLFLDRVVKNGDGFQTTDSDTIMNRDRQNTELVYVSELQSETKEREITLQLSCEVSSTAPSLLVPKQILSEESTTLELTELFTPDDYYVYAKGQILLGTENPVEAIKSADENRGVVIGAQQAYVWKRGRSSYQSPLTVSRSSGSTSTAMALSGMISAAGGAGDAQSLLDAGKTPCEVLSETITDRHVYDLTGCTLDQILYFVSLGVPVYAQSGSGEAVLVVGYDASAVWIYDVSSGASTSVNEDTAAAEFAAAGNVFYAVGAVK